MNPEEQQDLAALYVLGSLDANEVANIPDRPEFAVVDSNHDDKISASEFDAFFQLRSKASAVQILLDATEQGSDLFKTLDHRTAPHRKIASKGRFVHIHSAVNLVLANRFPNKII